MMLSCHLSSSCWLSTASVHVLGHLGKYVGQKEAEQDSLSFACGHTCGCVCVLVCGQPSLLCLVFHNQQGGPKRPLEVAVLLSVHGPVRALNCFFGLWEHCPRKVVQNTRHTHTLLYYIERSRH